MQRRRPRPGLVQAQHEPPSTAHEHRRDVQDPVAERLRLRLLELIVQTGHLRPGEQRTGDEACGHPGEVLGEAGERQVG